MVSADKKSALILVVGKIQRRETYLFNKPLPVESFEELLPRGQHPVLSNAPRMALLRED